MAASMQRSRCFCLPIEWRGAEHGLPFRLQGDRPDDVTIWRRAPLTAIPQAARSWGAGPRIGDPVAELQKRAVAPIEKLPGDETAPSLASTAATLLAPREGKAPA